MPDCRDYFHPTRFRMFAPGLWTWFAADNRTNNNSESFHSALAKFVAQPHLSFYKFLNCQL